MTPVTILCIALGILCAVLMLILFARGRWHRQEEVPDNMEGHDFEYYCADLLQDAGFEHVEVTRGSGDFGADILAVRDGVTYAVQCKSYDTLVGVFAVQQAYAGKAYYDCMVAAVITNQYFTGPAKECAKKLNVLLWDRDEMKRMNEVAGTHTRDH